MTRKILVTLILLLGLTLTSVVVFAEDALEPGPMSPPSDNGDD